MKTVKRSVILASLLLVCCVPIYGEIELGGDLENRITYAPLDENSIINPGNLFGLTEVTVENVFRMKLNLDLSENAFARVWLSHNYVPLGKIFFSQLPESERRLLETAYGPLSLGSLELEQAFIDLGFWDTVYIRVGKQLIPWGTGFVWNPTDNFNPAKNPISPRAVRVGVDALSIDVPLGNVVTFSAVGLPQEKLEDTIGAGKVLVNLFDLYDVSVSLYGGKGRRSISGFDFAGQLWEIGLHGEGSLTQGSDIFRFEKRTETVTPLVAGVPVGEIEAETYSLKSPDGERLYPRFVVGADYTFPWGTFVLVEYYRNEDGYDEGEMTAYTDFFKLVKRGMEAPQPDLSAFDGATQEAFGRIETSINKVYPTALSYLSPGRIRKNYILFHLDQVLLDTITVSADTLWGLDDMGVVVTPSINISVAENVSLTLRSDIVAGDADTEFRLIPFSYAVGIGIEVVF